MLPCAIYFERYIAKHLEEHHLQGNFLLTWEPIYHIPQRHIQNDYQIRRHFKHKIEDKFKKRSKKRVILGPLLPQVYAQILFFTFTRIQPLMRPVLPQEYT
jgi:hypothetical protein